MNAPAPFDPEVVRRDFPIFEREFHGRRLAYLDSAATSLKPRQVSDAVTAYDQAYSANVHRAIYAIGEEATAAYERHNAEVRATIPAGRLFEYQPGDGWEPICEALGVPVPDEPFPHTNTTAEFRANLGLDG